METKDQSQEETKLDEGIKVHDEQDDLEIEILDINEVVPEYKAKKRSKEERAQFDRTTFFIVTYSGIVVLFIIELVLGRSMLKIDLPVLAIVLLLNVGIGYMLAEAMLSISVLLAMGEVIAGFILGEIKLTVMGAVLLVVTVAMRKLQKKKEVSKENKN